MYVMIIVSWGDAEQTLIVWILQPGWTWEMYWGAFAESVRLNGGFSHRVDVIVDTTQTADLPLGALGAFKSLDSRLPDNVRFIVIAGGSRLATMMIQMMARLYKIDAWRTTKTVAEAKQLIAQDRAK